MHPHTQLTPYPNTFTTSSYQLLPSHHHHLLYNTIGVSRGRGIDYNCEVDEEGELEEEEDEEPDIIRKTTNMANFYYRRSNSRDPLN